MRDSEVVAAIVAGDPDDQPVAVRAGIIALTGLVRLVQPAGLPALLPALSPCPAGGHCPGAPFALTCLNESLFTRWIQA